MSPLRVKTQLPLKRWIKNLTSPKNSYLRERHPRDDRQHDLLPFGGVGVLLVLLQPGLQGAGGLPGGRFGSGGVSVRILAVRVEALRGVDRQGRVGARVLQLVLRALLWRRKENVQQVFPKEIKKEKRGQVQNKNIVLR